MGLFTCTQARLVGRALFPHALHKYGVHGLHSTLLIAWMMTDREEKMIKMRDFIYKSDIFFSVWAAYCPVYFCSYLIVTKCNEAECAAGGAEGSQGRQEPKQL